MNTVQREPKSIGAVDCKARLAKSATLYPNDLANVSINEPHPDEQASFNKISWIIPSSILIAFISCPPISKINDTSSLKYLAAVK